MNLRIFRPTLALSALALWAAIGPVNGQTFSLGGPGSALDNQGYDWGSSEMAPYRAAITNAANFGPSGIVHTSITAVTLSSITSATLAAQNAFISPWWDNTESAPYQTMIVNYFLAGGSLILLVDDSGHDGIATQLGIPNAGSSDGSASNGGAPLFVGPFGTATNVQQSGNHAYLTLANITSHGGTACGMNASNQIVAACFSANAYAHGAGAMLIVTDVDMWAQSLATYSPNNANGMFALNGTAYLVNAEAPTGTPTLSEWGMAFFAILLAGCAALTLTRKNGRSLQRA